MTREDIYDVFRDKVLKALDEAANETFRPNRNDSGATDADLSRIFKAVDAQVDVLFKRYAGKGTTPKLTITSEYTP